MKLSSSLKQKKRYVVFEIKSDKKFSSNDVQTQVEMALKDFLGQLGLSKASPIFLKEKYKDNKFILKVNHKYVDEVISACVLITSIKNTPVILKSITTSGILKKTD
jgi:ribonuclease P/MRP protein subunit POP5